MKHLLSCLVLFSTFSFTADQTNYSLSFDGVDDEVIIENNLNVNNQLTISAWINYEEGGTHWPRVISNDYNSCESLGDTINAAA